jgi:signal transduction histidine kinase
MKARAWQALVAKYRLALADYVEHGTEEHLSRAYELGRTALNLGLGVMDIARLHQEALVKLVAAQPAIATTQWTRMVETFQMETLSAFEVAHRGFRDACDRLQRLNATLAERNHELAASNRKLADEVRERKEAEKALRESREHYIQLFKEARAMEENLRQLSNKVLTVQEEERKHISRELHDEIGQALTAVNVSIAALRKHADGDEVFRQKVDQSQRLLEQSMEHVHRFARELRPSMLDHLGPYAALQNYVKSFSERTGIKAVVESNVSLDQLDNQQGTVLYRVAQESLTNVFKHAQATRVRIKFSQLPSAVCMEVSDNGRAFVPPSGASRDGRQPLGLLGMQERVRLVNGQFAIESAPRRGTTVRVQIPLSTETTPDSKAEPAAAEAISN